MTATATLSATETSAAEPIAGPRRQFSDFETVADLAAHFGVPAERIVLTPLPFTATEEDCLVWNKKKIGRFERVDRTLIRKRLPPQLFDDRGRYTVWPYEGEPRMARVESRIATTLIVLLGVWICETGFAASLFDATDMQRMADGTDRQPDLSVFFRETMLRHYPGGKILPEPRVSPEAADLVVEVISLCNTETETTRRRHEYFASNTRQMRIVRTKTGHVEVWDGPTEMSASLGRSERLSSVHLPGFEVVVDDWLTEAETI